MEDNYTYILNLKYQLETEYYRLKSQYSYFNDMDINNIMNYYDDINIKIKNLQLEDNKLIQLYLLENDIEKLLSEYNDGIYGVINYIKSDNNLLIKYITDKHVEYYNKSNLVKKIIDKNKFTETGINESYGIVFIYEKNNNQLNNLNKVYLLKNGDIDYLNDNNSDEEDDNIITKIYEFGQKIILKEIIYDSSFEKDENNKELEELKQKQLLMDNIIRFNKKYKKYIEDNIKSEEIKKMLINHNFIKMLVKKVISPINKQYDITNILNYDFENKLSNIKFSNKLEQIDYDNFIINHFNDNIEDIIININELYNIDNRLNSYLYIIVDILFRIYIDLNQNNKSYCLSKDLINYFDFTSLLTEPDSNTNSLKRRHWINLLDSNDKKKIISSLLILINSKTKTLDNTFRYFESLFNF
jgi:hypothetical protein